MTSGRATASEAIATFASRFDSSSLSPHHVHQCARALADTYAVAVAGRGEMTTLRALAYVASQPPGLQSGRPRRPEAMMEGLASLWGSHHLAPMEAAALHNGIAAHVLDYDDVASPMSGHPSVALFPALIALAQGRGLSGRRLASAYVVGFEIACRLGRALGSGHYDRGWHMTSTVGTIAATAACGHLAALDAEQIAHALGLAVAQTGGTRENFGTDAKAFQAGQCGAAALRAVLLAEAGFTSSVHAIDGPAGYMALYSTDRAAALAAEQASIGEVPLEIDRSGIEIKKYPTCYATHRPLDGIFDLRRHHGLSLDNVARIAITTSASGLAPLLRDHPESGIEGKFSLPYVMAAALADGNVGLSAFSENAVARPALRAFFDKVAARETNESVTPRWAQVEVELHDGQRLFRRVDALRGSPSNPLSDPELIHKLQDCLAWGLSDIEATSLWGAALQIGHASVRDVLARIAPTS